MSRRYGRNQKRAHRAQITALAHKVDIQERQLSELRILGARNRQIVKKTAQVLGKFFVTLPPHNEVVRQMDELAPYWRLPNPTVMDPLGTIWDKDVVEEALEVLELPIMDCKVARDWIGQDVHVAFTHEGKVVGYAISRRSLQELPLEIAVHEISTKMADMLIHELREVR